MSEAHWAFIRTPPSSTNNDSNGRTAKIDVRPSEWATGSRACLYITLPLRPDPMGRHYRNGFPRLTTVHCWDDLDDRGRGCVPATPLLSSQRFGEVNDARSQVATLDALPELPVAAGIDDDDQIQVGGGDLVKMRVEDPR